VKADMMESALSLVLHQMEEARADASIETISNETLIRQVGSIFYHNAAALAKIVSGAEYDVIVDVDKL